MGTRNLTVVVHDGKHKIAQYGQWDGYPNGNGLTALRFCRKRLATKFGQDAFARKLDLVRFVTDQEHEQIVNDAKARAPSKHELMPGMITLDQAHAIKEAHVAMDRDLAAEVLEHVWKATAPVLTHDQYEFAADSLFCEWAYVVDLDAGTFEAYKGFNTKEPKPEGRFASLKVDDQTGERRAKSGNVYYPVRRIGMWKLDDLPSDETFCALDRSDDEDE